MFCFILKEDETNEIQHKRDRLQNPCESLCDPECFRARHLPRDTISFVPYGQTNVCKHAQAPDPVSSQKGFYDSPFQYFVYLSQECHLHSCREAHISYADLIPLPASAICQRPSLRWGFLPPIFTLTASSEFQLLFPDMDSVHQQIFRHPLPPPETDRWASDPPGQSPAHRQPLRYDFPRRP